MNAFIRLLYSVLIAISVSVFVGVAIFSFYQPPEEPDYDKYYSNSYDYDSQESKDQDKAYREAYDAYEEKEKTYQRNVSAALLPLIAVSVIAGTRLFKRSEVIGEGLMLGGVALSIYAIITTSIADARILRFTAVTLLLASALVAAQFRFSDRPKK